MAPPCLPDSTARHAGRVRLRGDANGRCRGLSKGWFRCAGCPAAGKRPGASHCESIRLRPVLSRAGQRCRLKNRESKKRASELRPHPQMSKYISNESALRALTCKDAQTCPPHRTSIALSTSKTASIARTDRARLSGIKCVYVRRVKPGSA